MAYVPGTGTLLPTTTVTDVSATLLGVIGDNIVPILGLFGLMFGIYFVIRLFNKAKHGSL